MNTDRRRLLVAAGATSLLSLAAGPVRAQSSAPGNYTTLSPEIPVEVKDKVEVIEFFWYGCIHCYTLEPALEAWEKKLPAHVRFVRVPAVFNPRWARDAATFYAFEALGVLNKVHRPFFDAIHIEKLRTDDSKALSDWLSKNGVDVAKFDAASKSFGVQSKVRRASQLSMAYKIEGTPTLGVHGRYTVSPEQGRSANGMLATVDHLVEKTFREMKSGSK